MERGVIELFFSDVGEYIDFLETKNERRKTVPDFTCMAILVKERNVFKYTIQLRDPMSLTRKGGYVYEYIRPFKPDQANLDLFNSGCAECARRLLAYLSTGETDEGLPPAFGSLACEAPNEHSPQLPPRAEAGRDRNNLRFFPAIVEARLAKRYQAGPFGVELLTDVICAGMVQMSHLPIARDKELNAVYAVAAEFNDLYLIHEGSGTHFLCFYDGEGHSNLGCSDTWGYLGVRAEGMRAYG